MTSRYFLAFWILLVLLGCVAVEAQQVFVRNRPFAGKVVKDANGLWLELAPLEEALGFQAEMEADGARVKGRLVRVMRQGDLVMVPLSQVAAAVGAAIKENPEFSTVDVHLDVGLRAGLGLEVDPSSGGAPPVGKEITTAAFAFVLPESMQVTRDPRMIKAFLREARNDGIHYDAMVYYKGDRQLKRGAAVFFWFNADIPREFQGENTLLQYQNQVVATIFEDMSVEMLEAPRLLETGGQRFVLGAGVERRVPHHGLMALLRIEPAKKRFYQVVAAKIPQNERSPSEDFLSLLTSVKTR